VIGTMIEGVTHNGMPVFFSPHLPCRVPVLQLSPDFSAISPEARQEMNGWLLETFGRECKSFQAFGNLYVCKCVAAEFEKRAV
jgi:hypothetical protein